MVLSVTKSIPITAKLGEDTNITITGTDFSGGAVVKLGASEILAENVVVVSATQITCTVPDTVPEGSHDIKVEVTPNDATLQNGLLVVLDFPDPPFTNNQFSDIITRMLQRLPAGWDTREGSTNYDILAPFAMEIAEMYVNVNSIVRLGLATNAVGAYLDYKAIEFGLTRAQALKATGSVTFSGTNGTLIPAGTEVSTSTTSPGVAPVIFVTDINGTIAGGSVIIPVTAKLAGTTGNVAANDIDSMIQVISGVTTVSNAAATSGGANKETDDELRARLLTFARQPSHGGNIGDYIRWSFESSPDVKKVGVDPLGRGAGTVDVYILTTNNGVPSSGLLDTVKLYIIGTTSTPAQSTEGGKSPIGASVDILAATLVDIDVAVTTTVLPGFTKTEVDAEVETAIESYLNNLDIGADVIYHALSAAIMAVTGVNTISGYTVELGTADVAIAATSKAVPDVITIS